MHSNVTIKNVTTLAGPPCISVRASARVQNSHLLFVKIVYDACRSITPNSNPIIVFSVNSNNVEYSRLCNMLRNYAAPEYLQSSPSVLVSANIPYMRQ